ncbi:hypothetical protein ANOM_008886 [Aspergillus nomiae NRRL 13137]|uniref:propanoyl-CoA C-acyltransferase n=1 Tax=Aspergillus nomiae NRRL (strain ATCC 15546 / NRRL 13137 / CBS 260.88 / M93) TaxID=1509407 RepID=A0A0L1IU69_ASPN3|nr:uncharacterized protein ANOM_008886 [Aspergillus nomiae NRRL 13137]KNG82733.1 hypothetical protein ANOM_008886 [Aspergillus nomiae NRRL 13137]
MGGHLTKLQCCPTSDGAAAAVLVSQAFLDQRPELKSQAILIAGQGSATDSPDLFAGSLESAAGSSITKAAVKTALDQAGLKSVHEIKVCELHDCFAPAEMLALESLGFAEKGKAFEYVRRGDITYGGKTVVNPSGGLLSKGHPLGATGLAQCAELVWQLRGWANNRLVEGARAALSHNVGMGGFGVVTVYKRADGKPATVVDSADVARLSGVGYNPAVEARGFTEAQASLVRSKTSRCDWAIDESQKKVESHF